MKNRLLGLVLLVSLVLTPVLASAVVAPTSPMDGLYVATQGFVMPSPMAGFDVVGMELGIGGTGDVSFDPAAGVYMPSASLLGPVPVIDPVSGFSFTMLSPASIVFSGVYESFDVSGSLWFSNPDPDFGFMNVFLNMTAIKDSLTYNASVLFDKQTATPIPGALLLLGTGLVGLVGLRKKFQA